MGSLEWLGTTLDVSIIVILYILSAKPEIKYKGEIFSLSICIFPWACEIGMCQCLGL